MLAMRFDVILDIASLAIIRCGGSFWKVGQHYTNKKASAFALA
jgi:hypothetical protein